MSRHLFLKYCALMGMLYGCSAAPHPTSTGKDIGAPGKTGMSFITLEGFNTVDAVTKERTYFLSIGKHLRELRNCKKEDEAKIWKWLDRQPRPLFEKNKTLLKGFEPRPALSCQGYGASEQGKKSEPFDKVYQHSSGVYFSTGVAGEYYRVQSGQGACAYEFAAQLFDFEKRLSMAPWGRPPKINGKDPVFLDLSCENTQQPYQLLVYSDPADDLKPGDEPLDHDYFPFKKLIILNYESLDSNGNKMKTSIPIHRLNGEFLGQAEVTRIVEDFKTRFGIKKSTDVDENVVWDLYMTDQPLFDICLENCGSRAAQHSVWQTEKNAEGEEIYTLGPAPNQNLKIDSDSLGNRQTTWSPDGSGQQQLAFQDCETDLLPLLGLGLQETDWFEDLHEKFLATGLVAPGQTFVCPAKSAAQSCEWIIGQSTMTTAEFKAEFKNKARCGRASHMNILLDSSLTLEGPESLTFPTSMNAIKTISMRPLVPGDKRTLTFRYPCNSATACTGTAAVPFIILDPGQELTLRDLTLVPALSGPNPEWSKIPPRLSGFRVLKDTSLKLERTHLTASNGSAVRWNKGAVLGEGASMPASSFTRFQCLSCSMDVSGIAIEGQQSRLVLKDLDKDRGIRGGTQGLWLIADSEALVSNAALSAPNLMILGSGARVFVQDSTLEITPPAQPLKPNEKQRAFRFIDNPRGDVLDLEILGGNLRGFPGNDLNSFSLAQFGNDPAMPWSMAINLTTFHRWAPDKDKVEEVIPNDKLGLFLKCEGQGVLMHRLDNRCQSL